MTRPFDTYERLTRNLLAESAGHRFETISCPSATAKYCSLSLLSLLLLLLTYYMYSQWTLYRIWFGHGQSVIGRCGHISKQLHGKVLLTFVKKTGLNL